MNPIKIDVDGYLDTLDASSTERALFKAVLPFCDERLNVTGDAVAAILAVLSPVLEQANQGAIYAQTLQQIAKRPRDAARLAYDVLDESCSCPRYGPENGFDEGCPIHGNKA